MTKKESLLVNRLKSIKLAFKGAFELIRTESSVQIQFVIAIVVTIAGFYYDISRAEWILQIICIGLVLSIEGVNTAIEKLSDFIHPEQHQKIGLVKDVSAGAVLFAAITAIVVGLFIYIPKIF